MNKQPDDEKRESRRVFTKSVAATLISAPIIASFMSCKNEAPTNQSAPGPSPAPSTEPTPSTTLPRVDTCVKIPKAQGEDHIPPMFLGDGSMVVATGHDLKDQPEQIHPPGVRKWRYTVTGTTVQYGNIASVQPLVELDRYFDSRFTYMLADQPSALRLWLQGWDPSTQDWKQPPPAETDEPHIVVKGKAKSEVDPSYDSLVIEVDDKFSKKSTNNHGKKRPFKRERPFGPNDDQSRVYRWAIVDAANQVITAQGQAFKGSLADDIGSQGFKFMVRFFHH